MTNVNPAGDASGLSEAALVAASTELLEGLNTAESPLSVVSASLAGLATTLGVTQVMVAIDDSEYGRQVFCSGRTPLGDGGELLWGPPRVRTDPPRAIDDALGRLIVAAVTTTFERARTSRQLGREARRPHHEARRHDAALHTLRMGIHARAHTARRRRRPQPRSGRGAPALGGHDDRARHA